MNVRPPAPEAGLPWHEQRSPVSKTARDGTVSLQRTNTRLVKFATPSSRRDEFTSIEPSSMSKMKPFL